MSKNLHRVLCATALFAVPLAGCGDDDGDGGGSEDGASSSNGDAVVVEALDSLSFGEDSYTAPAGTITFEYVNDGSLPHTLVVEDHEDDMKLSVGDTDTGTIDLEAGEYVLYCDVPGHRDGGMEAAFTVE